MVKEGAQLQNKYGHYKHDSMVGVSYGTKVSHCLSPSERGS